MTHDSSRLIGCTTPPLYASEAAHGGLAIVATIAASRPAHSTNPRADASPPPPPPLQLPSSELRLALKPPPRISSVSPLSGPRAGGTRLTISGSNLGTHAADVLNLTLGAVACGEVNRGTLARTCYAPAYTCYAPAHTCYAPAHSGDPH